MGQGDSVETYYNKCKAVVNGCYGKFAKANKDLLIRDKFIHGLPHYLKMAVLNQKNEKAEQAVEAALLAETVKSSFETRETFKKYADTSKVSAGKYSDKVTCFECRRMGHIARFCPQKQKSFDRPSDSRRMEISGIDRGFQRPSVDVVINDRKLKMIVDTGSCISILPNDTFVARISVNTEFKTASGAPLKMDGVITCTVQLENLEVEHEFYVGPVHEPVLGIDFLKTHNILIDTRTGELKIGDPQVTGIYRVDDIVDSEHAVISTVTQFPDEIIQSQAISMIYPKDLTPEVPNFKGDKRLDTNEHGVQRLLTLYPKLFNGLGYTNIVTHKILTADVNPINIASHRLPIHLMEKAKCQLSQMEKDGVIRRSRSAWCNPVVIVPKKSGDVRLAIDFRKLNAICQKDAYPMPRIDECIERLQGSRVYSVLDCNSGYYQIGLDPRDQQKTAFRFKEELWEFTRMPFGLSTAPATFCRLMSVLFANEPNIVTYLDDICIFSKSAEDHWKHLQRACNILQEAGLTLNRDKCTFCQTEIEFLGFKISGQEIRPSAKKWKVMKEFPRPTNRVELKRFLGLIGYYRTMIPQAAVILAPLFDLTRKSASFVWEKRHEDSFNNIKECMLRDVIRVMPDPQKSFIVRTDASLLGLGAVLLQENETGHRVMVECISKKFSDTQKKYSIIEQEAFAIIFALEKWEHFLLGRRFELETDHRPLAWLQTKRDCRGKLGRWSLRLMSFEFSVKHIPGKLNEDADALSRAAISSISKNTDELQKEQQTDQDLQKAIQLEPAKFRVHNGFWYRSADDKLLLCLPRSEKKVIWKELHENLGHGGPVRVLDMARQRFFWPKMRNDIKMWSKNCHLCNINKDFIPAPQKAPMIEVDYSTLNPMEKIAIDIMGPYPKGDDGSQYLFVMEDCFSKWAEAKPVDNVRAEQLIKWLRDDVFSRYSVPREIVLDRGSNMESGEFKDFCSSLGIQLRYVTAYHHQANPVERLNRSLLNIIRIYVSDHQKEWSTVIPLVLFSYRVSVHQSLKVSPYEALFGRQPRLPVDLKYATRLDSVTGINELVDRLILVHQKMRKQLSINAQQLKQTYDKQHKVSEPNFKVDDYVYLRKHQVTPGTSRKLSSNWIGPYQLMEQLTEVDWLIKGKDSTTRIVHVNLLKGCGALDEQVELAELRRRGRPRKVT